MKVAFVIIVASWVSMELNSHLPIQPTADMENVFLTCNEV